MISPQFAAVRFQVTVGGFISSLAWEKEIFPACLLQCDEANVASSISIRVLEKEI
jgi:hypothetical protein